MESSALTTKGASSEAPFSFTISDSNVCQILYKGESYGKPFVMIQRDTSVFVEMMNKAYSLGIGSVFNSPSHRGDVSNGSEEEKESSSPSAGGGLSINICDTIRTKEAFA